MKATLLTPNTLTMNSSEPLTASGSGEISQPNIIRRQELAKRLAVSTRTIDNWMAKRLIPYIQISPRFYLYEFDAVLAALKKHYGIEAVTRT
jgi:predicted DNA-binding transcriptional regulator AlpA